MFNKKKILATTLGAAFALSAFGSAFAAETTIQTQTSMHIEKHFGSGGHFGKKGANLEDIAKKKGISVEGLKAQIEQEREAKLAEQAAEQGITVDELIAQREQKRTAKLEELAKLKGITVDELKAQFEKKAHGFRGLK